jgi:hypothetical protein
METVLADAARRHSVAGKFQKEARADGPHKVFASHLYRAIKRIGWELKLHRDVDATFDHPFVPFAIKAWSLCFPGASEMPERTVEQVMREHGLCSCSGCLTVSNPLNRPTVQGV